MPAIILLAIAAEEVVSSAIRVVALGLVVGALLVVGGSFAAAVSEGGGVAFAGAAIGESSVPMEGGGAPIVGIGV